MTPVFSSEKGDLFIDGKKVIKAFESWSGWFWFATEKVQVQDSVIGGKVYKNDQIWFGFVQGLEEEWGDFSESEIMSLAPRTWEIPKKALQYSGRRNG